MAKEKNVEPVRRLALTVAEVAESIGLSAPTVYDLVRREDFPTIKKGQKTIVPVKQLEQWLDAHVGDIF